ALHAQGDINNVGGTLEAETLAIVSEAGDFVHAVDGGKRAHLVAEKELLIEVDGDMRLQGSEINTGGVARIDVGRDLTIESTLKDSAVQGDYNWQEKNGVVSSNAVSQQRDQAQLTIGGTASIRSGRDLNLKAAELSVAGSAKVDVGRDVNIESLTNKTTVTVREKYTDFDAPKDEGRLGVKSPGLDSKKRVRSDIETTTHLYSEQESQFSVNGDLVLSAGRDFTLDASSLEVEGAIDLSVDGDLTLHSKDSHLETTISTKDTYIRAGRRGSGAKARVAWNPTNSFAETAIEDSKEVVASNRAAFVAGGDLNIQVRGNVLSQRSDLVGGDAVITSKGSIHNTDRAKIQTKDLLLAASGSIENSGGSSIVGEDLSLLAGDSIS
ncbi:MAG: hemagglutinin repeat-containing protein, partial [Pseudomonadota bacterium]|nr:hemagglutinin repeat-containing protein [Pseudomonadota bacterium]